MDIDRVACTRLSLRNSADLCRYSYFTKHCAMTCALFRGLPCHQGASLRGYGTGSDLDDDDATETGGVDFWVPLTWFR